MSASEKLKALDEGATTGPWNIRDFDRPNVDPLMFEEDRVLIITLRNALPQIRAVVEAAELKPMHIYVGIRDENGRPTGRVRYPLVDALAALEEALA